MRLLIGFINCVFVIASYAAPGAETGPTETQTFMEQAAAAERHGDSTKAVELATKAINSNPKLVEPYFFRGRLYGKLHSRKEAIADFDKVIELAPSLAQAYQQRGSERFKTGDIEGSLKDFDRVIELMPAQAAYHWQRGISLYYAGRYAEGKKQFEEHQKVNPQDVENAVWHFLCVARESGLDAARKSFIPIQRDWRIPLLQVHALFAGKGSEAEVMKAVEGANPDNKTRHERLFYAHLYLGLYDDITGKKEEAVEHLRKAANDFYEDNYMGDVARVHLNILEKKDSAQLSKSKS
jgi:lipoprotein NlpI